jgi:hypothetical protein
MGGESERPLLPKSVVKKTPSEKTKGVFLGIIAFLIGKVFSDFSN